MDLASGAAGLISLAGLAVQSASTLYTFCHKVPRVAGEVEAIISEIRALIQALESIQQIASDREAQKCSARTSGVIAKLQEGVTRCTADLEAWNTGMAALKMEDEKWAKNAVKKLKLAADAGRFSETKLKISTHRGQLGLLLELLTMDLDLSTSLDIQVIDSKVDDLAVKQTSSHQITVGHLEKVQERVEAVETLQSTSLAETVEISRSTSGIQETLHDIQKSQATSHQTTCVQVERLGATLAAIQRSILGISTKNRQVSRTRRKILKPQPRRHGLPECRHEEVPSMQGVFSELVQQTADLSIVPTRINNLVDLAVTVRYRCGKAHFEPLALPDPGFEAASFETKLRMVKYLQDLRLLHWLLRRKEYTCHRSLVINPSPRSELVLEARLVSSWTVWTTLDIASLGSQTNIRCREVAFLCYLEKRLCSGYMELGSEFRTQKHPFPPLIGLFGKTIYSLIMSEL
ncbi:hypothetical protein BGZ57DRAFT_931548 [Hyaloscypha finlandica]|nr:hypothetical protein BGZ57DRAFT_931548 [Hyaloscypha finlandica]